MLQSLNYLNSRFTKIYIKKFRGQVPSLHRFPCSGWSCLGCAAPSEDAVGAWRRGTEWSHIDGHQITQWVDLRNHRFSHEIWEFIVIFPLNQSIYSLEKHKLKNMNVIHWLVVEPYPSEKYDIANWMRKLIIELHTGDIPRYTAHFS